MRANLVIPLDQYEHLPGPERIALTIGVFDGVHVGHQELIRRTQAIRDQRDGWCSAALTFDPHPAVLFSANQPPLLLDSFDDRISLISDRGVDRIIVAQFDREFAEMSAQAFVRDVLVATLHVGAVVVGEDFRYGRDRAGSVETLRLAGAQYGFDVETVPQVYVEGVPARSTVIRNLIFMGKVTEAAALLGRPVTVKGLVVGGQRLGRTIGFPTANLRSDLDVVTPGSGVYAGRASVGTETFRAAISIGNNPTVAQPGTILPQTIEAHILDGFDRDIYGAIVTLQFTSRLRAMEKYSSLESLVAQIKADVAEVTRRLA